MKCFDYSDHKFQEKYNHCLVNSREKDVDSVVYPSRLEDKGYYNYIDLVDLTNTSDDDEEEEETQNENCNSNAEKKRNS